jgi:hypothetical protein
MIEKASCLLSTEKKILSASLQSHEKVFWRNRWRKLASNLVRPTVLPQSSDPPRNDLRDIDDISLLQSVLVSLRDPCREERIDNAVGTGSEGMAGAGQKEE